MNWKFPYYDVDKGIDWEGIERDFDWFRDMADTPQDEIWHAEGNVQIHTKMVVEALLELKNFKLQEDSTKHILVTAALMHDIEKRSTTTTEERDGRICVVAPRHAQKGEKTARIILYKELDTPFATRELICALIRYHGLPLWGLDRDDYHTTLAKAVIRTHLGLLLAWIAEADVLGRDCPDKGKLLDDIIYFQAACDEMKCLIDVIKFKSDLGRYYYLNKGGYIDYEPFDESKFTVYMMSGIAGSGKDTYIKETYPDLPMVSLDEIRRELNIKPTDKKGNGRVIQEGKERCKILMREHKDFVYNGTNITRDNRGKWISLFEEYGGKVVIDYIEVPYKTLISQNHNRDYKVPEDVINKMIDKLEIPFHEEAVSVNYNITT